MNRNRGLEIAFDMEAGILSPIYKSDPTRGVVVSPTPKSSQGLMLEKLPASRVDELLDGVPPRTLMKLRSMISCST